MNLRSTFPALLTVVLAMGACDQVAPPGMSGTENTSSGTTSGTTQPPTTQAAKPPPATAPTATGDATTATFVGLTVSKPATWVEHPPLDQMRKANFTVPGTPGNDAAEIVVFFFGPGQGGDVDSNIARWVGQFQAPGGGPVEPGITELEADGMPVTRVELVGEWRKFGQNFYTPDQMGFWAIVEAPVGRVFIRLAGPTATVEANRDEFDQMIQGLKKASS